jgi:hypothetical protein
VIIQQLDAGQPGVHQSPGQAGGFTQPRSGRGVALLNGCDAPIDSCTDLRESSQRRRPADEDHDGSS